ncbi:efflux RND transporter periplasmic adaptor subunit [Sphingomonas sp.]|uniref:efflux RND transporter periplasmic adaptor subunit n=1 Tax=Sphingomonas sp. TaxID=28214 RepID=UPI003CC6CCE5
MRRGVILLGAIALAGCGKGKPDAQASAPPPRAVQVATVEERSLDRAITASGTLRPREEAAVGAELAGYRVLRVLVDVGSSVRRGQALIVLDPALLEAQIGQERASLDQAQARARNAADQARRVAGLNGSGVVADEVIVQRDTDAAAASGAVRQARAALDDSLTRRARLTVRSPVAGVVLTRGVRPGDVTGAGTTPYLTLARDGLVELQAELAESDLRAARPGAPVQVRLADGTTVDGSVRLVSPAVDAQSRLGLVYIRLPVRADVRAGGFASARFGGAGPAVHAVPEAAVVFTADGPRLTVVDARNRAHEVRVRTGTRGGGWVELVEGPPVGTRVALGASSFVIEGEEVRPTR